MFLVLTNRKCLSNFDLIPPKIVPVGACAGSCGMGVDVLGVQSQPCPRAWMPPPMARVVKVINRTNGVL